jgi:hypothetical protein
MGIQSTIEAIKEREQNVAIRPARSVSETLAKSTRQGRILQVFMNADFRCAHDGLAKLAKDKGIDVENLEPAQYVVFINTAQDRVKVYAAFNVLAYMRSKSGKIDLTAISRIPEAFRATGGLNYDKILKETLEASLRRKRS